MYGPFSLRANPSTCGFGRFFLVVEIHPHFCGFMLFLLGKKGTWNDIKINLANINLLLKYVNLCTLKTPTPKRTLFGRAVCFSPWHSSKGASIKSAWGVKGCNFRRIQVEGEKKRKRKKVILLACIQMQKLNFQV